MVDLIYIGDDKINFQCEGVGVKRGLVKGDIVENVPEVIYERDLKDHAAFSVVVGKSNVNKMEKSTKGAE